ncbi:MAG: DUF6364 family protein [Treponema sp.]|jgi:hypothetical protein|nr:DUF6364 family protein [Treponema sp.]
MRHCLKFPEKNIDNTKLTLNIDQKVIENAKEYAKHQKRSVSRLVEEYLSLISSTTHLTARFFAVQGKEPDQIVGHV